jgi:hypothetical protein
MPMYLFPQQASKVEEAHKSSMDVFWKKSIEGTITQVASNDFHQ